MPFCFETRRQYLSHTSYGYMKKKLDDGETIGIQIYSKSRRVIYKLKESNIKNFIPCRKLSFLRKIQHKELLC